MARFPLCRVRYNDSRFEIFYLPVETKLMANKAPTTKSRKRSRYVMAAMVLGTALSAIGAAPAHGALTAANEVRAIRDISRYCTACWRNARLHPDSWNDCTQEVFCRLLERVTPDSWERILKDEGQERREFLRAIDAVKKRTQRGRRHAGIPADDVVADRRAIHEGQVQNERQAVYEVAADVLTPRQQRILHMSADGWSVQEIGKDLHISADRVSDEKYKAIRKLRTFFKSEETAA